MIATELHAWRCANPTCPSKRTGQGQIIMRGPNVVGWVGESRCHQCRMVTRIHVMEDGIEYLTRPCR